MDGSETGWDRPAEPAPRWRALLDRARHGGRPADQGDGGHHGPANLDRQPPAGSDPLPRRTGGSTYAGRAPIGYPMDGTHHAEPAYPQAPGYPPDPAPAESRYAMLENGYRAEPGHSAESRYALLDSYRTDSAYRPYAPEPPAYQPPAPEPGYQARVAPPGAYQPPVRTPAPEPVYPPPAPLSPPVPERVYQPPVPEPAYQQPPAPEPAYQAPAAGYPARLEWRPKAEPAEPDRATTILRRDLGPPRVLAFANPKGGVHKTTATVLAAATIGSVRGRGVLAWDDNELRGTLGLRAGSARHARTIRHLIADLADVEIRHGEDLLTRLDDFLRHASDGSYDVLAGEESPRFAQQLDQYTVRRVLELLCRTHDVICVDTGNNVESANWRTVMQATDQLVLTMVPREDAAFSADWMLDLLHEVGMGELADNAVTLLSCPTPGRSPLQNDLERHFATRTRAVTVVPYDPALETGSSIEYHQLQQETRDAWLRATSVMLEPFGR